MNECSDIYSDIVVSQSCISLLNTSCCTSARSANISYRSKKKKKVEKLEQFLIAASICERLENCDSSGKEREKHDV